jgi:hypothetical protein
MAEPQTGRIGGGVLKDNLNLREDNGGKDFLNFKNTSSDTALLHLDAVTKRISINNEAPTRDLFVPVKIRSVNANTDTLELPNYTIENSEITNTAASSIYLNAASNIQLSALATDQILIDGDRITTSVSNANIDLDPNGSGTVEVFNELRVYGNMHSDGNISMGGNLIFGDGPQTPDRVAFDKTIDSDIIPDTNTTFNLGAPGRQWKEFYTNLLNGEAIRTSSLTDGADDVSLRQGNIFYVSVNGDDADAGDHQQGPFRTIKRALQAADSSVGGPVSIYIFPGDYEEEFPLTVPANTTIIGDNIRTVIIRPDTSSQTKDAFLLNGETGIENLTIKDYYYDSLNDTGYAFRFAPGMITTTRSPYIRNVSVFTQGTTITAADPRGFASGDAGRGALIDGADVDSASTSASMLFYACTFMTPNADCISMTNGVRVEWLNSFTYFANRGLYAYRGATGHLSSDGSTVEYGAEVRAIGSANVYGNYGAVADGLGTLMYLIQHNFAYIGVGKETTNDNTLSIPENETVKLNNGQIHFTTTDQKGTFRVGDGFFVDLESGSTSIDATVINFGDGSELVLADGIEQTIISGSLIQTGNIRITNDTIQTLSGDLNLYSVTPTTNISSNVNISNNLSITGNIDIAGGLIRLGDQPTDKITLNTPIEQNFLPDVNSSYNLGSDSSKWLEIYADDTDIDDIRFFDNVVTTTVSNANLEFASNAAGTVNLKKVTFREDTIGTTVDSDSSPADLVFDPNNTQNLIIDATSFVIPNGTSVQRINQLGDLRYNTNDNVFEGYNGTSIVGFGGVYSGDRRTAITADLNNNFVNIRVDGSKRGEVNAKGLEIHGLVSDSISFQNRTISTIDSNADLEIRRNGTGSVYLNEQEYFRNSEWTNANSSGAFNIYTTGDGYIKFADTFGLVANNGQYIKEDTSLIALGTGLSGATLVTSVVGGVSVVDAGTGSGSTGGFDTYRHYKFEGAAPRAIVTGTYDLTNFAGGTIFGKVIVGNNSNGGEVPDGSEDLTLEWSDDGVSWTNIGTIAAAADFASLSIWSDFSIDLGDIPGGFNPATVRFRAVQLTASETSGDNYAIVNFGLKYSTDQSSSPETGATRYNVGNGTLEVYDGTNWIASTGVEEDPVTEEYMLSRGEIWTLILG